MIFNSIIKFKLVQVQIFKKSSIFNLFHFSLCSRIINPLFKNFKTVKIEILAHFKKFTTWLIHIYSQN